MKKILLIVLAMLSITCKTPEKSTEVTEKKPNVLIIFPDQLRRYSAGFWSEDPYKKYVIGKPDPVITPTIDKLAKNGVVFTQAISNYPLCSPYRGMFLSGMYPEQNGIWNNCRKGRDDSLRDDIKTITDLFYESGYNTSYFGKCHWLKTEPLFDEKGNYKGTSSAPGGHYVNTYDTYVPAGPSRHSIEYFYQSLKDEHYNPHIYASDSSTIKGKKDGDLYLPKIYSPKNEANKIISYLQNKHQERNSDKPFLMIWSLNPPHNPWNDENTDMDALKKYYDTDKYPQVDEKLVVRENASLEVANHYVRNYFANVTSSDAYIGIVIDELERMGALDNTIVIFSSDHGEMLGSHGLEGKNVVEMESTSIPFIVHWPKGLKANINDILLSVPDVLPTTMGLAGIADKIPSTVQGTNFAPLLENPTTSTIKKPTAVLLMLGNSRGIITDRYTLCLQENKKQWDKQKGTALAETFIYDNKKDPYQLHKLSLEERPEVAKHLLKQLGEQLKHANDPWFKEQKYSEVIPYPSL